MQLEERRWTRNLNGSGNRGQMRLDRSLVCAGILSHISHSEPTLACEWKNWKVGPIKDVSEDSLDWIALGRRAHILNPTPIKLGPVISSSLAHVKRLVIHFYLFKQVRSCQCWFSWRILRASWQMSLKLLAAACNLGMLAPAVLGFAICAELSFSHRIPQKSVFDVFESNGNGDGTAFFWACMVLFLQKDKKWPSQGIILRPVAQIRHQWRETGSSDVLCDNNSLNYRIWMGPDRKLILTLPLAIEL